MSVKHLEEEFQELVARLSAAEVLKNSKLNRCILDIRRMITELKKGEKIKSISPKVDRLDNSTAKTE